MSVCPTVSLIVFMQAKPENTPCPVSRKDESVGMGMLSGSPGCLAICGYWTCKLLLRKLLPEKLPSKLFQTLKTQMGMTCSQASFSSSQC